MLKKEFQKQRIEELSPEIVEVGLKIAGKMDDNRDIYSYSNPFKMHGTFAELYEFSVVKDRLHWKGGPLVAGGLDNLKGLRMLEDRLESYPDV